MLKKLLTTLFKWPASLLFAIAVYGTLCFFHPLQWIALKLFGPVVHQKVVDLLQWFLCRDLLILGNTVNYSGFYDVDRLAGKPVVIMSNHQSMFDISPIGWRFRKLGMTYIAKKELGRGIPSLSFNIKHGDSIAIDRHDKYSSEQMIREFAKVLKAKNKAVLIFPEGTRSRDGVPKQFKKKGMTYLFEEVPEAILLPVTVNNSWKIFRYGAFPFGVFNKLKFKVHEPMQLSDYAGISEMLDKAEQTVTSSVNV